MGNEDASAPFRICGACNSSWSTEDGFIRDPEVRLIGLQSVASESAFNLLVFEHRCGSSISVLARRLRHLLPDAEPAVALPVLFGSEKCRGHCRLLKDLEACDAPCDNVRDRALIRLIQSWKNSSGESVEP